MATDTCVLNIKQTTS